MPPAKPIELITSPTSGSSSTDTRQSSLLKFQPPSSIPLLLLSTITSPCTPTFLSSRTFTAHSLFYVPPSTSCHNLVPLPPSKVLTATPGSSLHVVQRITEEVQILPPGVPHVALINKTTGSDNWHFFFNTLKNKKRRNFHQTILFALLSKLKKYFTEVTIQGCSIQSSFKQVWVTLQVCSIVE